MKPLLLLCCLLGLVCASVASADTSTSGYTAKGQGYFTTYVTASGGFTATASFVSGSSRTYVFEVSTGVPGDTGSVACSVAEYVPRGASASLSCFAPDAGAYRLTLYVTQGSSQFVTVSTAGATTAS